MKKVVCSGRETAAGCDEMMSSSSNSSISWRGCGVFEATRPCWRQQVERLTTCGPGVVTYTANDLLKYRVPEAIAVLIARSSLPRPEAISRDVFLSISQEVHQRFWSGDVDSIECVYKKIIAQKMIESDAIILNAEGSLNRTLTETTMAVDSLVDLTTQFYGSVSNSLNLQPIFKPPKQCINVSSEPKLPVNDSAGSVNDIIVAPGNVSSKPLVDKGTTSNIVKIDSIKPTSSVPVIASANNVKSPLNHLQPKQQIPQRDQHRRHLGLQTDTKFATLPDISTIQADKGIKLGIVRVVKPSGCTVRNDIDIDNSREVHKLRHLDEAYFDQMTLLPAIPNETVAIYRLHIYFNVTNDNKDGNLKNGWASLKGRTFDDMQPILEIVQPLEKAQVVADTPMTSGDSGISSSDNSVISRIFCPFCASDITLHDMPAREHHVNNCGQNMALPTVAAKRGKENDRAMQQQVVPKKSKNMEEKNKSSCPICARLILSTLFQAHVNECLND